MAKKKKKSKKPGSIKKKSLTGKILGIFSGSPSKTYNYKQLTRLLNIKDTSTRQLINVILGELTAADYLTEIYTGKYKLKSKGGYIYGTVEMTAQGSAYINSESLSEDIFVTQANLNHALHGDWVKVYLYARRKSRRLEGEVVEIVKRGKRNFVGTVEIAAHFAFLLPDSKKMPYDIYIPKEKLNHALNGQKAIARIVDWPQSVKNPTGEIVEVLGEPGEHEVEMHAILAEYDLPYSFPKDVEREAAKMPDRVSRDEYRQRKDFRTVPTFTIDPEDAKDFDDALSIRQLDSGRWEVGVHIADVTFFISPNSVLDKEAQERGTSVYLVDRVIPMLPEKLSNQLCSLRPEEDKLCFSTVFEMDDQANVVSEWMGKSVIRSDRRFTYEEAQKVIETGQGDMSMEVMKLHQLAQTLRKRRFENGSIDFERTEVAFEIDEKGTPLGVFLKQNKPSNQLIEEFMLLANKRVAEFVGFKTKPPKTFVYRVHDRPDQEKLSSFAFLIKKFGHQISTASHRQLSQSLNQLLKNVQGKKEQNLIETLAIRTMAKAKYSTRNIGHYGLAFDHYSHFTSPIRRYPDMMVHRLLEKYLRGEKSESEEQYESLCMHASEMERKAIEAERASIKYKQVEFLKDKIGQQYDGIISGVADWGIYVEISENKCEGLIPIRELDDDFYELDEENYCITGRLTRKQYQLGDPITIEISRVDLPRKQVDLLLVE
jgi:ribonuclease R